MPATRPMPATQVKRVNDLYWTSPRPVDELLDELGISNRALYAVLRPLPAGTSCSECGGAMAFPNRTARQTGRAVCGACGHHADVARAGAATQEAQPDGRSDGRVGERPGERSGWARWREELAAVPPERAALVGGAAALGVVAGAAAARAAREMH